MVMHYMLESVGEADGIRQYEVRHCGKLIVGPAPIEGLAAKLRSHVTERDPPAQIYNGVGQEEFRQFMEFYRAVETPSKSRSRATKS